ncbi:glycine zipper 2TM domain-containing protein [Frateuria defendens]|uniref:glycine zipper 2TM domain-containing protein n=1 Tax=Frateuria defendens TaxID=2219559 RepID=UPI00069EA1E8|nr:glycine zipper 2TM domain-containing protein [Frateuria defendens]
MTIHRLLPLALGATLALATAGAAAQSSVAPRAGSGVLVRNDGIYLRCDECGTVQSIERNVVQGRQHGTAGAIIGAVAGGVLGNQVGQGKGRKLATVAGAVGGGIAGNRIGKGGGGETYTLRIRMGNGSYSNVTVPDASTIREGDLVSVDANGNVTRVR